MPAGISAANLLGILPVKIEFTIWTFSSGT